MRDGRDVMLYVLRDAQGAVDYAHGTLVDADGATRYLDRGAFKISTLETWESADGGTRYPSRWSIEIPAADLVFEVVPDTPDQENRSRLIPTMRYWEGGVSVRDVQGGTIGTGFVELTGYGESSRPAL